MSATSYAKGPCQACGVSPLCLRSARWSRLICWLGVLISGAGSNQPTAAASPAAFVITHLAYDTNGTLAVAPPSLRLTVTSLFYGEPVKNVIFTDALPPASDPSQGGWSANPSPAPPTRPQFVIDRWTTEHGLPANKVNALLQTRDGYLWIGTVGGLARFDGVRLVGFEETNTPEMKTNGSVVRALLEDREGKLWIGTDRGVHCHWRGRFVAFDGQEQLRGKEARCLAVRAAGGFWIGGDQGLGYRDSSGVHWCHAGQLERMGAVLSLVEGADRVLWVGTVRGLLGLDPTTLDITRSFLTEAPAVSVPGLMLDRRQRLWIGSNRGVLRLDRDQAELVPIGATGPAGLSTAHNARFAEDSEGNIWATTARGGGVICFPHDDNRSNDNALVPEIAETFCVLHDREGAIWIGGQHNGLSRLRRPLFATLAFVGDGMLDNFRSVAEAVDGSLWFASRACITHWAGNHLTLFDARRYDPRRISSVCVTPSGSGWAGFPSGGVFQLPRSPGDSLLLHRSKALFPELGYVQVLYPGRDGTLWLGTAKGLYHATMGPTLERIDGLADSDIRAVMEDRQGILWIGTAGRGLNRMDRGGVRAFTTQNGLRDDHVGALHESADGSLWIGTEAGLCRFRDGRFVSFTIDSGVAQDAIQRIVEDHFGRLWVGHAAGVSRLDPKELDAWIQDRSRLPAVADFGTTDGLLNAEGSDGSQPSVVRGTDGRLWFPTRGGLAVVDPAHCPSNVPPPHVLIEDVVFDGETVNADAPLKMGPGRGRHLDIRFTATSLHSPERVRLQYQLEGYDSGWRESGSVRLASYANLLPGEYRFLVRARNHEGRWSERDAGFSFRLAPHFWQTWPFYSLCGLTGAGLIGGFLVVRLRKLHCRLEMERVRDLELERRRIARDMHDHLGAQLAGIALASGANESAHQRVRESLRELNDLIWAVHPDNDTLPSLADFIANFAGRYLGAGGIELELDLPEQIPAARVPSRMRHELAAMFKEALRNVTQHAHAKRVVVRLRMEGGLLVLCVRDDGQGFDTEARGLSTARSGDTRAAPPSASANGLYNFHLRSESLGGKCRITSCLGGGTEVEFIIPLERAGSDRQ